MKKYIILLLSITFTFIFFGCFLQNPVDRIQGLTGNGALDELEDTDAKTALPRDGIADIQRSSHGPFKFETFLPVKLVVDVDFYTADFELRSLEAKDVIVLLKDSGGNPVFGGKTDENGILEADVRLPGAPEDMTLYLHAEGYESREVVIRNMVKYQEISRTMGMAGEDVLSRSISGLQDSDGDGIPDVYDAYPDDSDSAFAYLMPAAGYLTVAYEDLFGRAQAGDADYNDFIAHYTIEESSNTEGITKITVNAEAAVKLAGYNHTFGIRINYFEPPAELTVNYIDEYGDPASYATRIDNYPIPGETALEIILFEHTGKAAGQSADFTLDFVVEDEINNPQDPELLSRPPYNPYLYVLNTGHDVHLIDEEPIDGSKNPDDTFRDADGFPWALLVPPGPSEEGGWENPDEGVRIEGPYPRFTRWRESGGELSPDWYLHDTAWEPPVANSLVFASDRDGDMEIFSIDLDTATLTQFTDNSVTDKHPDISADGTKIIFVSNRSGSYAIHTMNADGTGVSNALYTLSGTAFGHPSWSPDGAKIAFDDDYELHTMNSDGSGYEQITSTAFDNEIDPDWSPDGSTLVYTVTISGGDFEIFTRNADGSGTRFQVTDNDVNDKQPSWSPDGTEIVYSTNTGGSDDIYTITTDGSAPTAILDSGDNETAPSWSENGIAYVRNGEIYTFQPGTPGSEENVTNNAAVDQDPSW